jgi:hypothetical protein
VCFYMCLCVHLILIAAVATHLELSKPSVSITERSDQIAQLAAYTNQHHAPAEPISLRGAYLIIGPARRERDRRIYIERVLGVHASTREFGGSEGLFRGTRFGGVAKLNM